jgi:chemotaxis protein CheX
MKSKTELQAASDSHEGWVPMLELAVREVFELMLASQLTVPATTEDVALGVTAMVGMAGQLCGVLSVRCDGKTAALMTSKMLGVDLDKTDAEMSDAMGEICNMVAGNFKNKISGMGDGCMLSPPTVITGTDYSMYSLADSPALQLSLLFENMPIVVSLQIHS